MRRSLIGAGLCLILAIALWLRQPGPPQLIQRELFVLGTLVQISVSPGGVDAETVARRIGDISARMQQIHELWAPRGDGALARLNAALADAVEAELHPELLADTRRAQEDCRNSGARFDPGVGALVRLWGFDDEARFRTQPPAGAAIDALLARRHSLCEADLAGNRIRFPDPGAVLDFGAAAKGRAVALAAAALADLPIDGAMINAGGDLVAIGSRGDRSWRVGIRAPRGDAPTDMVATLDVADGEAVFTSGDYERYFLEGGRRYHHILDPRSGWPAEGLSSATVVHADPWLADVASTALFVAGPDQGAHVMAALGCDQYLWITTAGERHVSNALAPRIRWLDDAG